MNHALRLLVASILSMLVTGLMAQEPVLKERGADAAAPSLKIEIADEPRAIDPVTLMPPALAKAVSHEFKKTPLRDLIKWLQNEQQLTVIVDTKVLSDEGILLSQQIDERLVNEPLYLLLDRLQALKLSWYLDDGNLYLTSADQAKLHTVTWQYNLGDLLDAGYKTESILDTIEQSTSGPWDVDEPGTGTLVQLGDVLFVRQTEPMQREVSSLLTALLHHGRRTLLMDCPQHAAIRAKLDQKISVNFDELSFEEAVTQLATLAGVDIRIDRSSIELDASRRQVVTLVANDQKLGTLIRRLSTDAEYTPMIRDGVLWVTTHDAESSRYRTAVFDVRDLCRSQEESEALTDAIMSQTKGPWDVDEPGTGTLIFPQPGTMVILQTEAELNEVLDLLETYRSALRASKPRVAKAGSNPKDDILTHYYRMPTVMAHDLSTKLPELVAPGTWKTPELPKNVGTLHMVFSKAQVQTLSAPQSKESPSPEASAMISTPYSVLIIQQTREVHAEIYQLIQKIENGDSPHLTKDGKIPQSSGGQQGGFGGGFFQAP